MIMDTEESDETGLDPVDPMAPSPSTVDAILAGKAPETINLATTMTEAEQLKDATTVCTEYERDWNSSSKYRKRRTKIFKLAVGDIPPPASGEKYRLARIHYAIIMTAVVRIASRIYDQQFPSNGEYFGVKPTDATDDDRSIRVAKHLNWQILHQIPEYVPNHDILTNQVCLYGSAFSYVYYNPVTRRICHEVCRTEDIVLPYKRHSSDPSLGDVPRITRILRLYRHELEAYADLGYYTNVAALYKKIEDGQSSGEEESTNTTGPMQEAVDKESGVEKPADDPDAPRVILEQHRWLKLKGEKKYRPVIATIDYVTKTLLCLKLREDEDPQDKARFNREKAANDAQYQMAMQQFAQDMAEYEMGQMVASMTAAPQPMSDPSMTPVPMDGAATITEPPMQGETTATQPLGPQPPSMPTPPADPNPPRMVPVNHFTHYICIPNPEGIYGLGIGSLLEGNNVAADTMASQLIDAATLSNTATGVVSRQAKLRGGDFEIEPGRMVRVDLSPQDLDKGISFIKFPPPEPALGQLINDQKEDAKELSGANEILSGEVGGSNETATTTQIRISQAMAAIAILNKRYTRARTSEGEKIARLNSVYLDDAEYFTVIDPAKTIPLTATQIGRNDYLQDVDITVTADQRMASQPQRFQEAMQAAQVIQSMPALQQMIPLQIAIAKKIFQAMDAPELNAALDQSMAMMMAPPPMPGAQTSTAEPPSPGGPPQPEPTGPTVPNAGPQPANGVQNGQGA